MTIALKHFPAGERGFFRAPVLLTGSAEAILFDGGFTLEDGRALASAIKASGKRLTTVFVTHSDPDYYFSLKPIQTAFPEARFIAGPSTVAAIEATVERKIATWGPKLKENGPQSLADVVIPTPSNERSFSLDGEAIEVIDAAALAERRFVWVPSIGALFGGVLVFSGVHVWTADTAKAEQRAAWRASLDALIERAPARVIPGHVADGAATDSSAITYTRDYLIAFEEELGRASDSGALIAAMQRRYPNAGMGVALDIGAKVAKGEIKWG